MIIKINNDKESKDKDIVEESLEEEALRDEDNSSEEGSPVKEGFFKRLKHDKKYKAKVELAFYGIIILFIAIVANFGTIKERNYSYTKEDEPVKEENNSGNLYENINSKYKADITVSTSKDGSVVKRIYSIDKDNDDIKITKVLDGENITYKLSDNGDFYTLDNSLVKELEIFDTVSYKYIDFDTIKKYIAKGTVDYTTKYSSGVELISYKTLIRDILLDNTTEDFITFNVSSEGDKVTIDIDYSSLLKSDDIDTCNIVIVYTDIGKNIENNK